MAKSVFIYPCDSYIGRTICKVFVPGDPGSSAAQRALLLTSDVAVYDLLGNEGATRDAVVAMAGQPQPGGREALFVAVSSPLVWAATRPHPDSVFAAAAAAAAEGGDVGPSVPGTATGADGGGDGPWAGARRSLEGDGGAAAGGSSRRSGEGEGVAAEGSGGGAAPALAALGTHDGFTPPMSPTERERAERAAAAAIADGGVPTWLGAGRVTARTLGALLAAALADPRCAARCRGFVLDGFPRSAGQARGAFFTLKAAEGGPPPPPALEPSHAGKHHKGKPAADKAPPGTPPAPAAPPPPPPPSADGFEVPPGFKLQPNPLTAPTHVLELEAGEEALRVRLAAINAAVEEAGSRLSSEPSMLSDFGGKAAAAAARGAKGGKKGGDGAKELPAHPGTPANGAAAAPAPGSVAAAVAAAAASLAAVPPTLPALPALEAAVEAFVGPPHNFEGFPPPLARRPSRAAAGAGEAGGDVEDGEEEEAEADAAALLAERDARAAASAAEKLAPAIAAAAAAAESSYDLRLRGGRGEAVRRYLIQRVMPVVTKALAEVALAHGTSLPALPAGRTITGTGGGGTGAGDGEGSGGGAAAAGSSGGDGGHEARQAMLAVARALQAAAAEEEARFVDPYKDEAYGVQLAKIEAKKAREAARAAAAAAKAEREAAARQQAVEAGAA
ncbi:hypothetical protein GPECTOR_90g517 [Gonium pectorale]|uniref:Adenylate kinase n=1 Tax=Gonium pectorale TaxID=33097 RepID=A0A150G0S6_GONPE|nr:hypothetical protein GPECTOR_90g517 [Gonium pectorale]|eukprot:KXZ43431.1 hypothetical protein GPECTOR_90g517 [Gonium pectorale]